MNGRDSQISFDARIERIAPEVPRYIVYPGEAWDESATFIVEVALNGIPIGLRNLIPLKERGGQLDCQNRYAAKWAWTPGIAFTSRCASLKIPPPASCRSC